MLMQAFFDAKAGEISDMLRGCPPTRCGVTSNTLTQATQLYDAAAAAGK